MGSNKLHSRSILLVAIVTIAGCTGKPAKLVQREPVGNGRPSAIYVYPFAVSTADIRLNQGFFTQTYHDVTDLNESQLDLGHRTASTIADQMVQQLKGMGFVASRVARGTRVSGENVLIIDGSITEMKGSNRLQPLDATGHVEPQPADVDAKGQVVSLTSLHTQVQLYRIANGNTRQIMNFGGAANSYPMNVNGVVAKTDPSPMSVVGKRSAKQTVVYMSEYFARQGWIPRSMVEAAMSDLMDDERSGY